MVGPPAPSAPERPLRVVLAVEGTRGDVYPFLALACSLRARGHDVLLCTSPDNEAAVRARGVAFQPVGNDVRVWLQGKANVVANAGWRAFGEMRAYTREAMREQLRVLPDVVAGADRVYGAGVQFGAACAAALHGVPYRAVLYCPAILPSPEHAPVGLPMARLPRPLNRLAWQAVLFAFRGLLRDDLGRWFDRVGLPRRRDVFRLVLSARPILAADRLLAPAPATGPFQVEQVPCLHPLDGWDDEPLPPKLESFLEQGPPPVFFGFGSMTDPDAATTTRAVLEAVGRLGCRALVSRGWAGLADGPLPEGVAAVETVSHARLFPRCAAVVHHGGAGTTTTAARAGVPQLVVPHLLDQVYWGARVRELGLGPPPLPRRRLRADALAAALEAVLENELLAERAGDLGARLRAEAAAAPDPATWVEADAR